MARKRTHRADGNQPEIVKALRSIGIEVHIIDEPVDLLCGWRGVWTLLEVKDKDGRGMQLTPAQQDFFENPKGPALVVINIEEAVNAVLHGQLAWP